MGMQMLRHLGSDSKLGEPGPDLAKEKRIKIFRVISHSKIRERMMISTSNFNNLVLRRVES